MSSSLLPTVAAAAAASDDGSAKRIICLEEDLVSANNKVGKLSFEHQQHLILLSRIYNAVTKDATEQKSVLLIKSMIEASNIPGLSMVMSPISRPQSAFSATTGPESSTSGTEDSDGSEQINPLIDIMGAEKEPTKAAPPVNVDQDVSSDEDYTLEEELAGIPDAPRKDRPALREALRLEEIARKKLLQQSAEEKRRIAELEGEKFKKMRVPRHLLSLLPSQLPARFQKPPAKPPVQPPAKPPLQPAVKPQQQPANMRPHIAARLSQSAARPSQPMTMAGPSKPVTTAGPSKPETTAGSSKPTTAAKPAKPMARRPQPAARSSRPPHLRKPPHVARAPAPEPTSKKPEASTSVYDTEEEDDDVVNSDILGIAKSPKATDTFGIVFDKTKIDSVTAARLSGKAGSTDARRSVLIENLPSELTLHKLLAYVRGGTIVTARLVPRNLSHLHGQMAFITFKTAAEAELSCRLTGQNLSTGLEDEGMESAGEIQITRLPTATYPTRQAVPLHGSGASGFLIEQEPTRCVAVDNFTRRDLHNLCKELSLGVRHFPTKMHALEEVWFVYNTLHMNFTSIAEAEKAHQIITSFSCRKYAEQLHYCADPCAATTGATGKMASSGMGLKSLLDTVGLAGYSRSQPDFALNELPPKREIRPKDFAANTQAVSEKALVPVPQAAKTQTPAKPESTSQKLEDSQLLIDIFGYAGQQEQRPVQMLPPPPKVEFSVALAVSIPWTAELMQGLDLL